MVSTAKPLILFCLFHMAAESGEVMWVHQTAPSGD